ncbi:MAG: hypothetical protein Fur0028_09230 [Bacteroidales bacterium]
MIGFAENILSLPNQSIYDSDLPYPQSVVEVVNSGYLDGNNHIITLQITPFQYFPKLDLLEELDSIEITLDFNSNNKTVRVPKFRTEKNQKIWDDALYQIVENKNEIANYQIKPKLSNISEPLSNVLKKPTPVQFHEYVIITTEALKPYFNNFINWKSSKGIDIGIVTTSSINYYYQGDGTLTDGAGKIRQYLRDLWECGGVWVLLGGDYTTCPIRYGVGYDDVSFSNSDYFIPTDMYFADLTGNWEVDNDGRIGEPNQDNPDYFPELFVGRLLCKTGQEILNWSSKVINYESNPGNGNPNYVTKCFMIESDEMQDMNQAEYVAEHLPSTFSINIWRELPSASSTSPTFPLAQQVLSEMNNHYGFYGWFGHGSPTTVVTMSAGYNNMSRWCLDAQDDVESPYAQVIETNDALDKMTNQDYPGIIYSIGCDQIPFDDYNTDPGFYNLGESYLVGSANYGGVAFLGNTRYGWINDSYKMFAGFADLITNGSTHLGVAELMSKYNYHSHYLSYSHNLLGCPETEIYTYIPVIQKKYFQNNTASENCIPKEYALLGNYPNPFNPNTTIKFALPYKSDVQLKIFDILGNEVRAFEYSENPAGYLEVFWDGRNSSGQTVSSGVYIYTVRAVSKEEVKKEFTATSKLLLLK